jgi:uncharacterized membrane protein YhaH (DUF805 family)
MRNTRDVREKGRVKMEWMLLPLKRYAQFSGRSRRMEYWMYTLFVLIVGVVLSIVDSILGLGGHAALTSETGSSGAVYGAFANRGLLANLFSLATLVPSLAVGVRRLHDTNRSGWWLLVMLVPYIIGAVLLGAGAVSASTSLLVSGGIAFLVGGIGAIVLLVWYCTAGTPGPNDYGDDPMSETPEELARTFE